MKSMPKFLENDAWYIETPDAEDGRGYHLTDAAPQMAIDSYEEYYADPEIEIEDSSSLPGLDYLVL